jgi:hypothetical protein
MSGETEILKDSLQKLMVENSKVKSSLGEIIIISTEDKIELCLMKHLGDLENKRGWITPFGLLLTVFLTFLTTDFKDTVLTMLFTLWQTHSNCEKMLRILRERSLLLFSNREQSITD